MIKITKEELASKLNGRQIGNEISSPEESLADENNLVVIFGASDDLLEFRGAIDDEHGAWDGGRFFVVRKGQKFSWYLDDLGEIVDRTAEENAIFPVDEENESGEIKNEIEAAWCPKGIYKDSNGKEHNSVSWIYKTKIPHSTFAIFEGDDVYCVGIVFSLDDVK